MNNYEAKAFHEIELWKHKVLRKSWVFNRLSKKAQTKINSFMPEKFHQIMTESIKNMVKATLTGSNLTTKKNKYDCRSLEEMDQIFLETFPAYQKTAILEGAGTGAGGFLLGLVDFPLLLSIKMKFLFETAAIYGYDTDDYEERLFILYVFKLAFSSDEKRRETMQIIEGWEERKSESFELDWREFQQEYRDYIDFAKILQLAPGIGAAVGAYANHNLMEQLGETAKNAYRLRILKNRPNA